MRIMGHMKRVHHLDPELFDHFVRSGVYREYGQRFLPASLVDEVDEQALLEIKPAAVDPPDPETRAMRRQQLRPEYQRG
jgi:hypothetical protein